MQGSTAPCKRGQYRRPAARRALPCSCPKRCRCKECPAFRRVMMADNLSPSRPLLGGAAVSGVILIGPVGLEVFRNHDGSNAGEAHLAQGGECRFNVRAFVPGATAAVEDDLAIMRGVGH